MHILTIIKANLRQKKWSFISIVFLTIFISTILTLVLSISHNSNNHINQVFKEADTGDLMLWYPYKTLTDKDIDDIASIDKIKKVDSVTAVYTSEKNDVLVNGQKSELFFHFQIYNTGKHKYNVYNEKITGYRVEDTQLNEGEIYLPISLKSKYDCNTGDKVEIKTTSVNLQLVIKGFAEEPTMGNPLIGGYKNVFISQADYDKMYDDLKSNPGEILATDIVQVYCNENSNLSDNELNVLLNKTAKIVEKATTTVSLNEFKSYSKIMTNIFISALIVFAALLLIVVLIVVGHSITTSIEMDYKNIGILKSQGLNGADLKKVYMIQYLGAIFAGCVIGLGFGALLVRVFNIIFVQITGLLIGNTIALLGSVIAIFSLCLFFGVFILIKTGKIGRIRPIDAIIENRDAGNIISKIKFGISKTCLGFFMALRQITSNIKQYISSFAIVILLVFFIMSIQMIFTCFESGNILDEFYGFTFDIEVDYGKDKDNIKDVEAIIGKYTAITSSSEFYSGSFTVKDSSVLGNAVDSSERFTNIYKGKAPSNENEIAITEVFAKAYNAKIGDRIDITFNGNTESYAITGYYQSVSKAGMQFSMLKSGLLRLDPDISITTYDYRVENTQDIQDIVNEINDKYSDQVKITTLTDVLKTVNTISSLSSLILGFVYSVSLLFVVVATVMICGKIFYMEKKNLGIYKALGFSSQNLRAQFTLRFGILGIAGSGIGILLSVLLNKQLIGLILRTMGITNFNATYSVYAIVAPLLLMTITISACAYVLSGKIKKIDTRMLIVE